MILRAMGRGDAGARHDGGPARLRIAGAILKTFVLFRLDKQKWTRPGSGGSGAKLSLYDRTKAWESFAHHALALSWLTVAIMFLNTVE